MIVPFWICLIFTVKATAAQDGKIDCGSNPCQNGATCLLPNEEAVEGWGYYCFCENGFSGKNCEVDDNSSDASNDYISTSGSRAFTSETYKISTQNSTESFFSTEGTTNNLRSSPSIPYTTSTDSSATTGFPTDKGSTITSEIPKLTNYIARSTTEITSKDGANISSKRPSEETLQTSTVACFPNPCDNGGTCLDNNHEGQNYYCICNETYYEGTRCEITKTPAFEETTEVIQSTFNSSYSTMISSTTANKDLSKSTTVENKASSTAVTSSGKTAAILEEGLRRNLTNFTELTEEFPTNVTTPFQEVNNTATSTTQLVSSEVTQSTYFSVSTEQNTLSVNTTEQEDITSNLTSTMKDTITPSPTTEVHLTITPSPATEEVDSTITPSPTTEELDLTVTLSYFINTTRSMPVTGSNKSRISAAAYFGIGVLSLMLILILTGGIIYSKKYREKKRISLYANVLGEETSSISNGSNCSFA